MSLIKKILKTNDDKQAQKTKTNLKRFVKEMIMPNSKQMIFALILMACFAVSNAALAWVVKPIINNVFVIQSTGSVSLVSLQILLITFVKGFSQYGYTIILSIISLKVMAHARSTLYSNFIRQDLKFFQKYSPSDLTSSMTLELNSINNLATQVPIAFGRDILSFIALLVLMIYQAPQYAIVTILLMLFIVIPMKKAGNKIKHIFDESNTGYAALVNHFDQTLHGIKEVKSYSKESTENQKSIDVNHSIFQFQSKMNRVKALLPSLTEFLGGASVAGILAYAGYQVKNHGADPGTFFSFIVALMLAYQPLRRLTTLFVTIRVGVMGVNRYYGWLNKKPTIVEKENAEDLNVSKANVEFKNVTFEYNKDQPVVKNLSFKIDEGKKVALVGESGSGKSTLVNLLMRFYDPNSGEILIDNQNIKDITFKSLRNNVSMVSQDIMIFRDTAYNNILYGNPNATKEQVIEAAKQAFCYDFIMELEKGFDTELGTRGSSLSGGQKQRISIARALLKNSPILVLDEATSALDTESEKYVQKAIDKLMIGKTTLIIAHRLSTVINSDIINVMNSGEIIESGSHEDLLKLNGYYKKYYDMNFS